MTIAVFLGSLLGAMALGIPIAFSLLLCGVALMWHLNMFDAQILAQNLIEGANSFPLLAVPFFMLAGEVMNTGGLSKRIVNFAMALVGHVRGGLGYVTIVAACLLSALSGSAVADAAALTALLLPMMVAAGHNKERSAGLIASAGIIAPVIPPSITMILFGVTLSLIGGLQLFEEPFILTNGNGGTDQQGMTSGVYLYRLAFEFSDFGGASAMSWMLFGLIALLTWLTNRAFGERR